MKYLYINTIVTSILGLLFSACTSPKKDAELRPDYLYGKWTCRIMDGEYTGIDSLNFNSDLKFKDAQSLSYKSSDSGFDFFANIHYNIGGTWEIKADSLFINYNLNSFTFHLDPDSFKVNAYAQGADTTNMKELRHDMLTDLSAHLRGTIESRYRTISSKSLFMGRVTYIDLDSMIISNNGNSLILYRVKGDK